MLSTLILGIVDKPKKGIELLTIGDGLICCNGNYHDYDQDNKPDYLGYHLDEDFSSWYQNQLQKLSLEEVKDISISTDGIFSFKKFDGKDYDPITEKEIIEYLLVDENWADQEHMLKKKLSKIENHYGMRPSDDLTIIRMRF